MLKNELVLPKFYTITLPLITFDLLNNFSLLFRLNNYISYLLINRYNPLKNWYRKPPCPHADQGCVRPILPPPSPMREKHGKVLHIDGNADYLNSSLALYKKYNIPVVGINIEEKKQPEIILSLLNEHRPNILVITGHDALAANHITSLNLNDYKHSKYFVQSVKLARIYNYSYDELVIIAGGCRSHYEALMDAGANFASSPGRVLINVTDPAYIAYKIATTSIREIISAHFIITEISAGLDAFGGLETKGQSRAIVPGF